MQRKVRARLTIAQGNAVQCAMALGGIALVWVSAVAGPAIVAVVALASGYLLIYFSTHAPAHWLVGRLAGIRFTHYSIGGSTQASAYPPGMRQVFERLPFFAVHSDKASLRAASPLARALMFGAGMTSSVLCCTLVGIWAVGAGVPGAAILLAASTLWFLAAVVSEARQGDYAKAGRNLG
jgi:hypothetical protein